MHAQSYCVCHFLRWNPQIMNKQYCNIIQHDKVWICCSATLLYAQIGWKKMQVLTVHWQRCVFTGGNTVRVCYWTAIYSLVTDGHARHGDGREVSRQNILVIAYVLSAAVKRNLLLIIGARVNQHGHTKHTTHRRTSKPPIVSQSDVTQATADQNCKKWNQEV